ncbi:gliding motility-associated C-terminal domain-containing protein [Tenacibaculum piscium]|uniref:Adhesin SprC n=1 Tax=Tenacibaculum piscium TaxID=1458515 RepID=A0A2H1YGL1_9FLAO|nr:gliding motility-associated C-terminal domain-containing protein [Tenacibaculum piscium]MBE7630295.1 hypothetical protein [Tenacibaculum piscium]SOS74644.1 Putative adhesin precursor SprC [Tenacibaculum piscium]
MKRIIKSIHILLGIFLFFASTILFSQELLKPEIQFVSACDTEIPTDYKVVFKYSTTVFASDNEFTIELSDGDGTWDAPVNLATVATENETFTFSRSFQLPDNSYGKNYKIRLVATSPAMISPESDSFEAYKMISGTFILNDFKNVFLCDGDTSELTLNTNQEGDYKWFKDGGIVATTTQPVLEVSTPGKYQVKIDYGACGFKESTLIDVFVVTESEKKIKGPDVVEICGDQAHTFEANVENPSYIYNWYFNTNLVQSSSSATYTTPTVGQLGNYYLEIDTGTSCITASNEVELTSKVTATVTVSNETPLVSVLLLGEKVDLSITVNGTADYTIEWYKDTKRLFGIGGTSIEVSVPGEYIANIVETSTGGCTVSTASKIMSVLGVKSFLPVIIADENYEECNASGVDLSLKQVNVVASDDEIYVLTPEQLALLSYQWTFNKVDIPSATNKELTRSSHTQSGVYTIQVSHGGLDKMPSNELDIKMIAKIPTITASSASNSLCSGGKIIYTIDELVTGYTYEWFQSVADSTEKTLIATNITDLEVTEIGTYSLKMSGFGCSKIIEEKIVVLFDDSAITVTPSEKIVLPEGEEVVVTASGAESYKWYKGTGENQNNANLLGTTESLSVNTLGFYTVIATVGSCSVQKTIEAIEQDNQQVVPNVITPNGDGKNDSWKISNRYAFQEEITVELYDSTGKLIVKTTDYKNDWPLEDLGNQVIFYYKIIRDNQIIKAGTISVLY